MLSALSADDMFEDQGLGLDLEREFGGEEPERARAAGNAVAGADAGLFGLTPGKEQGYEHAQGMNLNIAPCIGTLLCIPHRMSLVGYQEVKP